MKPTMVINCHAHPHAENEVEEKRALWDSPGSSVCHGTS